MTMGIEDVVLDVGAIEARSQAAPPAGREEIGPVVLMGKVDRYSLHPDLLSMSLHHRAPRGGGKSRPVRRTRARGQADLPAVLMVRMRRNSSSAWGYSRTMSGEPLLDATRVVVGLVARQILLGVGHHQLQYLGPAHVGTPRLHHVGQVGQGRWRPGPP